LKLASIWYRVIIPSLFPWPDLQALRRADGRELSRLSPRRMRHTVGYEDAVNAIVTDPGGRHGP